ncbi:Uncharacterised protein [Mycobacteroides abscessus subsp. abscessus]|nr:Uncharacterised protein [Mycobacteroides abscessus subsp. abscessus]
MVCRLVFLDDKFLFNKIFFDIISGFLLKADSFSHDDQFGLFVCCCKHYIIIKYFFDSHAENIPPSK